jgi:hypothetical protein
MSFLVPAYKAMPAAIFIEYYNSVYNERYLVYTAISCGPTSDRAASPGASRH